MLSPPQHSVTDMQWQLPTEHYQQALQHEASLVCLMLIDRKAVRLVDVSEEDFIDWMLWKVIYTRLKADCFTSISALLSETEDHAARTVADSIQSYHNGAPRVFAWNLQWHCEEVTRLATVRREFMQAIDFVLEHAA